MLSQSNAKSNANDDDSDDSDNTTYDLEGDRKTVKLRLE